MNPLIVTMLGAVLRMGLLGLFATLIEKGIWTEGQVETLAVGLAGFLATAIWALWNHYKTRLKFLTALDMPPGTTEAKVNATLKAGGGATLTTLVLAGVIGALTVSGCGPKTKPVLVKTDAAVYEAITALHQTAVVLGTSGVLTPAQELKVQEAILPVAKLGESTTRVIVAWKSGPTPPELQQLVREMGALTARIIEIVPQNPGAKAALLAKVALVQQAIATVLIIMTGGAA